METFMKFANLLIIALACTAPSLIRAQAIAANSPVQGAVTSSARTITLDFTNTPTRQVLESVARQAGLKLIYKRGTLSDKITSTVKLQHVAVDVALRAVMRGTGAVAKIGPDGETILVASGDGQNRQDGIIAGRVLDTKSGKGVSGANITVDTDNRGVVSAEDGTYRINVASGSHTVTVRLVGYAKQTRQVTVGEGVTVAVDFKLEPSASVLDQVVVTGTIIATELKAVPNAITVITAKQIEERGITRIDQLFRGEIPGLFALNMGSNAPVDEVTMFSRGVTALIDQNGTSISAGTSNGTNPIKTYIDGIEMANAKYLSQIDPSSIERIEILTGPQASTIYGAGAINGVMQVFTKRGRSSKPQITLNWSSGIAQNNFSSHLAPSHIADISLSGIEGRLSYNVGSSWNYEGSWTPSKQTQRLSSNGGVRMEWGLATFDVTARRGLTKNRLRGDAQQVATNLRATGVWSLASLATQGLPVPQTNTLLGQTLGASIVLRPYSWWSHDMGLGSDASTTEAIIIEPKFSSRSDTTLVLNPVLISKTSQRYTTTVQLPISSLARFNVTLGGDHFRTKGSSWFAIPVFLTGSFSSIIDNASFTRTRASKNSGAFIQGQMAINDALFLTYGVRADWNPNFGDKAKVKPGRYGVSYTHEIGPVSTKLRGSYGRSIRPPSEGQKLPVASNNTSEIALFGPFDRILGNPDLGPEHQQGGEGGVELYLGSRASLIVTRFNQTVDNLISLVGSNFVSSGPGLDSVRSLIPPTLGNSGNCSSAFRDADDNCFKYQQQYLNVGSIRNQGWELTGSLNFGPLTTHGTYSWTKSRVVGVTPRYRNILTGSTFQIGRPFDYLPEHTWALGLTYSHSANSVSIYVNGIGMRYTQSDILALLIDPFSRLSATQPRVINLPSGYRTLGSGYAITNLNATHNFSHRIDATLQVVNLTNYYQNEISSRYAAIGRQTRAGLRMRF